MAPERITVTVQSNIGEDGPLTVGDALRQVIDMFKLVEFAQGETKEGGVVKWRLVYISKSSPLRATAEAFSSVPGIAADFVARRAKAQVSSGLRALMNGEPPPTWMKAEARTTAKSILNRNMNGVGLTTVSFEDDGEPAAIVEKTARVALLALERAELSESAQEDDLSRVEFGSIEGEISDGTRYYGQPALKIRERLNQVEVTCVLSSELRREIGTSRPLEDIWSGRRVLVTGEIHYRKEGTPQRVMATRISIIDPARLDLSGIADPNYTGGLSPGEHLSRLWSDEDV